MVDSSLTGPSIDISSVSEYWNRRPCNIRHGRAPLGTKEYFDQVEQRKYMVESHIPKFAEFAKWKGKKVLEIGCGIGTDSVNFARAGADLTVVELSTKSLELAKQRFEVFGLKAKFYEGNAEDLSQILPKSALGSFDLIYSFGVIHHTPQPKKVFEEILPFLRKSGEMRVMLYAKNSTKNLMIALGLAQPEAQSGCPVAFTYSGQEIKELLDSYEVTSIVKDHIFPYRIKDYVEHRYVKRLHWRVMPSSVFRLVERLGGWHLMIRAVPKKK